MPDFTPKNKTKKQGYLGNIITDFSKLSLGELAAAPSLLPPPRPSSRVNRQDDKSDIDPRPSSSGPQT